MTNRGIAAAKALKENFTKENLAEFLMTYGHGCLYGCVYEDIKLTDEDIKWAINEANMNMDGAGLKKITRVTLSNTYCSGETYKGDAVGIEIEILDTEDGFSCKLTDEPRILDGVVVIPKCGPVHSTLNFNDELIY